MIFCKRHHDSQQCQIFLQHLLCALPIFQRHDDLPDPQRNPCLLEHLQQLVWSIEVDDHIFSSRSDFKQGTINLKHVILQYTE